MKKLGILAVVLLAIVLYVLYVAWPETDSVREVAENDSLPRPASGVGARTPLAPPGGDSDSPPPTAQAQAQGPSVAHPPAPPAASERVSARFGVRWDTPGLCGSHDARVVAARAALLATFEPIEDAATLVLHDPSVDPSVLSNIQRWFFNYVAFLRPLPAGLDRAPPPRIYVYRDVEQMLSVSCVNKSAIGYYDGAIHVAGDGLPNRYASKVRDLLYASGEYHRSSSWASVCIDRRAMISGSFVGLASGASSGFAPTAFFLLRAFGAGHLSSISQPSGGAREMLGRRRRLLDEWWKRIGSRAAVARPQAASDQTPHF